MDELEEIEREVDGVWICGNYKTGVAFPDCVTFGYEHAKVVIDYLVQQSDVAKVEEEVVEEVDEAAAAAEAARVGSGQQKYDEASGFKPAKTAEGLPVIGHRGTWQNFGARESDRYNP